MVPEKALRILIAEDEYLVCEKIKEVVESVGYTVVGDAMDGVQAIYLTEKLKPDLILMDIKMPGMDGISATKRIQRRRPTPVVILTAYQNQELLREAGAAGVSGYLMKPPNANDVEGAVEIAMQRFSDMMEMRRLNEKLKREIEAREEVEQALKKALEEKNLLMKEILHRTKNNMTMVCSLLNLQSASVNDAHTLNMFRETACRVRSMAMVQERLYQTDSFIRMDLREYLRDLAVTVYRNFETDAEKISLHFDLESVTVSSRTAVSCGLILNELISNAVKYAFPGDRRGAIATGLRATECGAVELCVRDDGAGLPDDMDLNAPGSLGLQIVAGLAEQLDGKLEIRRDKPGVAFVVRFRDVADA